MALGGRQRARARVGRATGWCAANSDPGTDSVRNGPFVVGLVEAPCPIPMERCSSVPVDLYDLDRNGSGDYGHTCVPVQNRSGLLGDFLKKKPGRTARASPLNRISDSLAPKLPAGAYTVGIGVVSKTASDSKRDLRHEVPARREIE